MLEHFSGRIRHLCLHRYLLLPLMLSWATDGGTQPVTDIKQSVPPDSIIEIPISLSIDPLVQTAEKTFPQQAGNWNSWKSKHGIDYQYLAWRGPLSISVSADVLLVQAHIRYWIRAHKQVLGAINLKGSCGINEPPRQAVIGLQLRLGWKPDWALNPEFRLLPTRFLDRCQMTIANLDVTPIVEKAFRRHMEKSLRTALQQLAPAMHAIRKQAQRTWLMLQDPVDLGQGYWFMFNPHGIAMSGIKGQGNRMDAQLAVRMRPSLLPGVKPASNTIPLPPLEQYYPGTRGLNLHLDINLDFAQLYQGLSGSLTGKRIDIQGNSAEISKFVVSGGGEEISVLMVLVGDVAGTVMLHTRLAFDPATRNLQLHDLTYSYETQDPAVALMEASLHEYIRHSLESAADQVLSQHLDRLRERLKTTLGRTLPASVQLDISTLQLDALQGEITQQGIRLDGIVTGSVQVMLR